MKNFNHLSLFAFFLVVLSACGPTKEDSKMSLRERIETRDYPSVFQAWYGIDMPNQYPDTTLELRLQNAAKHDLIWEEPLSQLGEGVDLVLGLTWDHKHHGLATGFTKESLQQALKNRERMLEINPNMIFLFEVRWRDAPKSFLPENSDWWQRDEEGNIRVGWTGGWEPFYLCDYSNIEYQDNIARQCKLAIESGVYDGVMFDWSGNLDIVKKTRLAIGDSALIIVNIHDDIEDGIKFQPYINGSFMELNPIDTISMQVNELVLNSREDVNGRAWDNIREALVWFEANLQEPQINCCEVWGNRKDLSRMRAVTTLSLTHSDGYTLYADPNPLKTPDHFHDWYPFWDVQLGKPKGKGILQENGAIVREFDEGTVLYNHYGNPKATIAFDENRKRISNGEIGKSFTINDRDGDIFVKLTTNN